MTISNPAYAYFLFEILFFLFFVTLCWHRIPWKQIISRPLLQIIAAYVVFLVLLDILLVHLGFWAFPPGRSLPWRLLTLPLEEYILFVFHALMCVMLMEITSNE